MKPLPLLKTFDDAEALAGQQQDPFYQAAFLIQCWLGGLIQRAAAEYAEKKNPKDRSFQSGESWRAFETLFGAITQKGHRYLLACLLRFCAEADPAANSLRHALVPLSLEHDLTGDYVGPKTLSPGGLATIDDALARRTLIRWCDWLDAAIHLRTHRHWHLAPVVFDPDPERRELAALGEAQRHLAHLPDHARACWLSDFLNAAERYKSSPKWPILGKAMSADSPGHWQYAVVDTAILSLWPLVKAYNWTYADLLNVLRSLHPPPCSARDWAYPMDREQDFSAYCINVLSLRKASRGTTAKDGRPAGWEIAARLWMARGNRPKA